MEELAIRDEVLSRLLDTAAEDAVFREHALRDLDGALQERGFELTPVELAAVREFQSRASDLDDQQLGQALDRRQLGNC